MALTYNGTTAGSTLANPPVVLEAAVGGHVLFANSGTSAGGAAPLGVSGAKLWFYASSNDPLSELQASGTFNDGVALGMTMGDVIICVKTTAGSTTPFVALGVLVSSLGSTSFTLSSSLLSSTAQ